MSAHRLLVPAALLSLTASAWLAGPAAASVVVGAPTVVANSAAAPALSNAGRLIAYEAMTRDAGGALHVRIVRKDRMTGTTVILNRTVDGKVAGGRYSLPPVISGDGARVAFLTGAARLVADDTNGKPDAFVRDVPSATTILASRAFSGGVSAAGAGVASLSDDGRYVVFTSQGTDIVPGSTTTNADVYLRDLSTGTTRQVTVRPDGTPSTGPGSNIADVSADGRLVAFNSYDTDLAPADGNDHEADIFVRDMTTGTTRWLSPGLPVGADPFGVVISPDGSWVSSRWSDGSLHLTNVATATTQQVAPAGYAGTGAFSADGNLFAYNAADKAWVRNLTTGADTELRTPAGGFAGDVTVSGDGSVAAYGWTSNDGTVMKVLLVSLSQ